MNARLCASLSTNMNEDLSVEQKEQIVVDHESEVRAFLDGREWSSEKKRNEARAICIEFVKFQQTRKK